MLRYNNYSGYEALRPGAACVYLGEGDRFMKRIFAFFTIFLLLALCLRQGAPAASGPPAVSSLRTATLLAAGDNLIHDTLYLQAQDRAGPGGYDFRPVYQAIADRVAGADIAVLNQEAPIASDAAPVASYPRFCSPTQLGDQLIQLGFDVFFCANNHVFDQGTAGARAQLDYFRQKGVLSPGLSTGDDDGISLLERNGIRFAFLAYTYGVNVSPEGDEPHVVLFSQEEIIRRQVELARRQADVVVVSAHWGAEGSTEVTHGQRELAQKLSGWGADIILGSHPHVLQTLETLERADGGRTLVAYSLGNLVSHQTEPSHLVGGLLSVTVTVGEGGTVRTDARLCPVITHYGERGQDVRILPLEAYSAQLAQSHGARAEGFSLPYVRRLLESVVPQPYSD